MEHDIHFNKEEAMAPVNEEVQIEVEMEELTNPAPPNVSKTSPVTSMQGNIPKDVQNTPLKASNNKKVEDSPKFHEDSHGCKGGVSADLRCACEPDCT